MASSDKKRGKAKMEEAPPDSPTPTTGIGGSEQREMSADESYEMWKTNLVPLLYDWLANHNLDWPSLSCRWGPLLETGTETNRQRLYISEQTDGSYPNTLLVTSCEVVKPRVADADNICQFNVDSRSPFVIKYKTIVHPGEVSRIRELPQHNHIVATHTDSPYVYIWDINSQADRHSVQGAVESRPDVVLSGHKRNAKYALSMCPTEPYVLSGGEDKLVLLWSIQDHLSTMTTDPSTNKPPSSNMPPPKKSGGGFHVRPRGMFQGHDNTVEDVQFCPKCSQEFCSVGDDSCLILWDARTGTSPAVKVLKAHDDDIHCVDWNSFNENYILTGSADNSVRMFDRRNLTSGGVGLPVHKFEDHKKAVLCVQWCPDNPTVFGSAAEDGIINIWNYATVGQKEEYNKNAADGLFFKHTGHRDKVLDFHWNAFDPWTIASVSNDVSIGGGGTLQLWRITDMLYRPQDEVLAELEEFKSHAEVCEQGSQDNQQ